MKKVGKEKEIVRYAHWFTFACIYVLSQFLIRKYEESGLQGEKKKKKMKRKIHPAPGIHAASYSKIL